jgi:hypothetical protein
LDLFEQKVHKILHEIQILKANTIGEVHLRIYHLIMQVLIAPAQPAEVFITLQS